MIIGFGFANSRRPKDGDILLEKGEAQGNLLLLSWRCPRLPQMAIFWRDCRGFWIHQPLWRFLARGRELYAKTSLCKSIILTTRLELCSTCLGSLSWLIKFLGQVLCQCEYINQTFLVVAGSFAFSFHQMKQQR